MTALTRIRYPAGAATPLGCYQIRQGDIPMVSLISANEHIVFDIMGGLSEADPTRPECIKINDIRGLMAPWRHIEQQGATQDGVDVIDTLYEATEVDIDVELFARDSKHLRRMRRHLLETLDARTQSTFVWMTHEAGEWWAPIRWREKDDHPEPRAQSGHQSMTLKLQADNAFYQSHPDVSEFEFAYEDMTDTFDVDYSEQQNLGPNWPQLYSGNGIGYLYANGDHAKWSDDPDSVFFTGTKRVVAGPFAGFSATGDDVEVSIVINNTPEYTVGSGAANDIWARMGRNLDGTWNGTGIRGRIGWGYVEVAAFVNFERVWRHQEMELFPPHAGEVWTLQCGADGDSRRIRMHRDGFTTLYADDDDELSVMDSDHRGVGFGMQGGASVVTQATPGQVRSINVGDIELDSFEVDHANDLGALWPLYFEGRNDAYVRAANGEAEWVDNSGTETQEVVCGPYKDFDTETDNQVVSMVLGSFPEWSAPETGANDLWGRMGVNPDGTWDGNGIRLRVAWTKIHITAFVDFDPVWTRTQSILWMPHPGDKWTLVCGFTDDPRMFKVYRNGATLLEHKEVGTASLIGADYRGIGFGVRAGGALITQATPAIVRKISAGDNAEVTQSGYLERRNAGDQAAYDELTIYGPATKVEIANGPGSAEMVEIGPLAAGEIAMIRTDPRRRGVFDLTPRTGEEVSPALFGANPTDTMYRKLKGRFTSDYQIPPKEAGMRVATYLIKVAITGGNADSRVMASLTPLRRRPE